MLILVKNGLHACILGTPAALFLSLMVFFHLVPEMQKFAVFDGDASESTSVWSLTTGMLVASATLILRRPQHTVFLDTVCIDQTSAVTKAEGVLNMGAFLRSSKSMLVLWDSSYALRWGGLFFSGFCVFLFVFFLVFLASIGFLVSVGFLASVCFWLLLALASIGFLASIAFLGILASSDFLVFVGFCWLFGFCWFWLLLVF